MRRLILIGGGAGVGKTWVARVLAGRLGAGWLQTDTIWLALTDGARGGSERRRVLDIDDRLRHGDEPAEALLDEHVAAARLVCETLARPLALERQTHDSVVADGAWLLPEFVARLSRADASATGVFLHEPDFDRLRAAMHARRSAPMVAPWHDRSARLAWLYGNWLAAQAALLCLPVVTSRPRESVIERVLDAVEVGSPDRA